MSEKQTQTKPRPNKTTPKVKRSYLKTPVTQPNPSIMTKNTDKTLWLKRNKTWLMKWSDGYEEVDIPPEEERTMQMFRVFIPKSQVHRLDEYLAQHKIEIIMSAVFALPTTTETPFGVLSTMDGFLNQTGRLPTKKDKITFESPSGEDVRFMGITKSQNTEGSPGFTLLSECRIKIDKQTAGWVTHQ